MSSPAHPGPLILEEVAAVQAKVDDDALIIEATKSAIRSSGRLLIETKKVHFE